MKGKSQQEAKLAYIHLDDAAPIQASQFCFFLRRTCRCHYSHVRTCVRTWEGARRATDMPLPSCSALTRASQSVNHQTPSHATSFLFLLRLLLRLLPWAKNGHRQDLSSTASSLLQYQGATVLQHHSCSHGIAVIRVYPCTKSSICVLCRALHGILYQARVSVVQPGVCWIDTQLLLLL